jgi:vitamin B12 transporter
MDANSQGGQILKRTICNIFRAWAISISAIIFLNNFAQAAEAEPPADAIDAIAGSLDPLFVTPNRWGASPDSVIYPTYSVTSHELRSLPARDVADAVETLPGVIIDRVGGPNSVVYISIQGSPFYQTTVLVDGVPLNDMSSGLGNLGQIDASQIGKVEVVHGSAGAIWGSAMGGVVNVLTNNPSRGNFTRATIGGGDYGTGFFNAMANVGGDAWAGSAGGSYRKSSGPENGSRGESVSNGFGNVNYRSDAGLFWLKSRTYQGEVGTGLYQGDLAGYWEKTVFKTNAVSGGYDGGVGPVKLKAQAYNQTQDYTIKQYQEPDGWLYDAMSKDKVTGGSLIGRIGQNDSALTIGVEGKNGSVKANSLAKPESDYNTSSSGVFANISRHTGDLGMEATVRQSQEDMYGSFTGFGAGINWRTMEPVTLRISVSSGYTAPPLGYRFTEIAGYIKANPDLTTEKALTWQAGANIKLGTTTSVELNGFFANVTDAIAVTYDDAGISMYKNFEEFERKGVNASIDTRIDSIHFRLNSLYQETHNKKTGELVRDMPSTSFNARIGYDDGRMAAYLLGSRTQSLFSDQSNGKDAEWIAGVKLSYTYLTESKTNIVFGAGVYNATDVRLYDHVLLPRTYPRQAEASVSVAF